MNEKKTVYNALFESQEPKKVELGIIDDIRARSAAMQKEMSKLGSLSNEYFALRKRAQSMTSSLSDTISAQQKEINKASQKLKELGLDTDVLKAHNDKVGEALQEMKSAIKSMNL